VSIFIFVDDAKFNSIISKLETKVKLVCITPFGTPVLPLVLLTSNISFLTSISTFPGRAIQNIGLIEHNTNTIPHMTHSQQAFL